MLGGIGELTEEIPHEFSVRANETLKFNIKTEDEDSKYTYITTENMLLSASVKKIRDYDSNDQYADKDEYEFEWTPTEKDINTDTEILFKVCDFTGKCDIEKVSINVPDPLLLDLSFDDPAICNDEKCTYSNLIDNNTATVHGATYIENGGYDYNGTYKFDGTKDSYIELSSSIPKTNRVTYSFWVKPEKTGYGRIFRGENSNDTGWYTYENSIIRHSDNGHIYASSKSVNNNEWTHIVYTYNGTSSRVYINGEKDLHYVHRNKDLRELGSIKYIGNYDEDNFQGMIDDIKIYSVPLTEKEIRTLYNTSNNTPEPVFNIDNIDDDDIKIFGEVEKINNNEKYNNDKPRQGVYEFNGKTNNYIKLNNPILKTDQVTYSFWVKPKKEGYGRIFSGDNTGNNREDDTGWYTKDNTIKKYSNYTYTSTSTTNPVPVSEWTHIAYTFDGTNGTTSRVYINGELSDTNNLDLRELKEIKYIGKDDNNNTENFKGMMDDIKIYDDVLKKDQIEELYNLTENTIIATSTLKDVSTSTPELIFDIDNIEICDNDIEEICDNGIKIPENVKEITSETYNNGISRQGVYEFNGTKDNYIKLDQAITKTDQVTYSFWVKPKKEGYGRIFSGDNDNDNGLYTFGNKIQKYKNYEASNDVKQNEWTHIAYTYDGTNGTSSRVYINGVEDDYSSYYYNNNDYYNTNDDSLRMDLRELKEIKYIGKDNTNGSENFKGMMDDIKIYERVLSQDEIKELYEPTTQTNNLPKFKEGILVKQIIDVNTTLEFKVEAIDEDEDDILTYSISTTISLNKPIIDSSTGQFEWTPNENQAGKTYDIIFKVQDKEDAVQQTIKITVNTLPEFSSDTLEPVFDIDNLGDNYSIEIIRDIEEITSETYNDGTQRQGVYSFNGTKDNYIKLNNPIPKTDQVTYSFWVKPKKEGYGRIFSGDNDNDNGLYTFGNKIQKYSSYKSSKSVKQNEWTHIAYTFDGTNGISSRVYINGELSDTNNLDLRELKEIKYIGKDNTNGGENFKGMMDDIKIYDDVLSQDEIEEIYSSQ
jgi:hypothetical protein